MSDLNTVTLTGRLTADPELRYTPSGKSIASFNLANGRKYKDRQGELVEDTSFIGCTLFGQQADFAGQYLRKGQAILLQGRLKQETWEDKDTGKKQSKTKVVGDYIKSIDRRGNDDQRPAQQQQQQPTQSVDASRNAEPQNDDDVPF